MTNTTEMPEKIWARYRLDFPAEPEWSLKKHADSDVSYIREDTRPDVAELQRQNAVLKAFARTIINENCFGYGGEVDGLSAQDQAENCGLITPHTVTREMIDEWEESGCYPEGDFEVGDTIYKFAEWMKTNTAKIPIPSRAAVVREFMGETNWRYKDDESFMSWHGAAIQILKEWEDAESK